MNRSNLNKALSFVGMLLVASIFIALGAWQWDRAQENRQPIVVDAKLVELSSIAKVSQSLSSVALSRNVVVTGRYVAVFRAPNQIDLGGQRADWEAALLQTSSGGAILVVRGLWSEKSTVPAQELGTIQLTGKLLPHQYEDSAEGGQDSLQRLDSSVIVDKTSAELFDGYIVATAEQVEGVEVQRDRIAAPATRSAVPGFFWQHISYVIIWWVMAALVLYLPFYQRRVAPENLLQEIESE